MRMFQVGPLRGLVAKPRGHSNRSKEDPNGDTTAESRRAPSLAMTMLGWIVFPKAAYALELQSL